MRRQRMPVAFAGLLIIALVSMHGVAAFTISPDTTTTTIHATPVSIPDQASGRVAAAILATQLGPEPPPTTTSTTTTTTTTTRAPTVRAASPAPPRTTTAAPRPTTSTRAPTTTTRAPTTTTTTTTTTAAPPATTTTTTEPATSTTSVPTTTEAPVDGGPRDVEEWRSLVESYFPPDLVEAALWVIGCESNGDPLAVNSHSGAAGLFQFLPGTWAWASSLAGWDGSDVFAPEANIAVAAWLVQDSIDRGNDPWTHWTCKP